MYVLDTNILSHTAPGETKPNPDLVAWLRRNGAYCYLSAVTLAETSYGAARLMHKGATRKAADLQAWLRGVTALHGDRIIPVNEAGAIRAGELMAVARASGTEVDMEDALIAAAAELRGMIVLTDNLRHFAPMGVAYINPYDTLPPNVASSP